MLKKVLLLVGTFIIIFCTSLLFLNIITIGSNADYIEKISIEEECLSEMDNINNDTDIPINNTNKTVETFTIIESEEITTELITEELITEESIVDKTIQKNLTSTISEEETNSEIITENITENVIISETESNIETNIESAAINNELPVETISTEVVQSEIIPTEVIQTEVILTEPIPTETISMRDLFSTFALGDYGCIYIPDLGINIRLYHDVYMLNNDNAAAIRRYTNSTQLLDHVHENNWGNIKNANTSTIAYLIRSCDDYDTYVFDYAITGIYGTTDYSTNDNIPVRDVYNGLQMLTCHNGGIWCAFWRKI